MDRVRCEPRQDWQKTVESQGFHFHTLDEEPYWDESAYYRFRSPEIDAIEKATYALNDMCLAAAEHVVTSNRFAEFQIPEQFVEYVRRSWERDELTIYGRFDLAFNGSGPPKLLEYNADTPTALLEAAVIQWFWFKDQHPGADQFNSIHERLIEAWRRLRGGSTESVYFAAIRGVLEDYMTVAYLRDTAMQAGLKTEYVDIEDIGWNERLQAFVDLHERHIGICFKLYPWEWMLKDRFGPHLLVDNTVWLEAPWKMILSNKAILIVLHELYPDSPYLLPASFEPMDGNCVRKPLYSREGANIAILQDGRTLEETQGAYSGPYMYQQHQQLPQYDGNYPVIGSWMVNGYACGIGIREDTSPITQNLSRFVPHIIAR